jgi:hypothetical protein
MPHFTLDTLPAHLRQQAEKQLSIDASPPPQKEKAKMRGKNNGATTKRKPNVTEQRFQQYWETQICHECRSKTKSDSTSTKLIYEPLTFHLAGGSRYTPDFAHFDSLHGIIVAYEVKHAGCQHHSQGRAITAFREARANFPYINFRWFSYDPKSKTWEEKHKLS